MQAGPRAIRRPRWYLLLLLLWPAAILAGSSPDPVKLLELARSAQQAGKQRQALELYDRALLEFRRQGDDAHAAVCLNNSSVILLAQGDGEDALRSAREAVRLRRALGDPRLVGRSLTNSGRALEQMGRLDEAEADFRQALEAAARSGDRRDIVVNHLNLGVVAQAQGRYGEALASIRRAFEFIDGTPGEPWSAEQRIIALNNRGALYERIGEFRLALADYDEILRFTGDTVPSVPYRVNAATILRNLGDPHLALQRLAEAESILRASRDDHALHANLLSNRGLILHLNLRRPAEARPVLERAHDLARKSGDRKEAMTIGNYLGAVYLDLGMGDEAARAYDHVLEDLAGASVFEPAWEAHLGMARVLKSRGDTKGALRALLTAAALVEGTRLDLAAEFAPRRFLTDRLVVYGLLSSTLSEAGGEDGARAGLQAAERARERLLLSRWSRMRRRDSGRAREADWRKDLMRLSREAARLYRGHDGDADAAWRDIERRWEARSHLRLPEAVAEGEALVEYLIAGEESRAFWLTREGAGTLKLPPEEQIEQWSEEWLDGLIGNSSGDADEVERGLRLYEKVVRPVLDSFPPGIRIVRVVPDGALWRIPLDALPVERTQDGPPRRLLRSYEISLRPLLSALPAQPPAASADREEPVIFAFFGPPASGAIEADLGGGDRISLPPLPGAQQEIRVLRRYLGGKGLAFLGAEARESSLKKLASRRVRILHMATHALADPIDIGRTGIVFSREEHRGAAAPQTNDGFLSLGEILDMHLPVDLTFLSACSGAVGEKLPGEGLNSLAAGLIESGSRAVVASLWDVQDLPTRSLVEQFYDRLGRGGSFATALREAKLALASARGETSRPQYWAAWVLIGDGEATAGRTGLTEKARPLIWAALVALGLAGLYAARRLGRRTGS